MFAGPVPIDTLIDAAGSVRDVVGKPGRLMFDPTNHTALMKEKDQNGSPLLTPDYSGGFVRVLFTAWPI